MSNLAGFNDFLYVCLCEVDGCMLRVLLLVMELLDIQYDVLVLLVPCYGISDNDVSTWVIWEIS